MSTENDDEEEPENSMIDSIMNPSKNEDLSSKLILNIKNIGNS